jgi:hypothetical protein
MSERLVLVSFTPNSLSWYDVVHQHRHKLWSLNSVMCQLKPVVIFTSSSSTCFNVIWPILNIHFRISNISQCYTVAGHVTWHCPAWALLLTAPAVAHRHINNHRWFGTEPYITSRRHLMAGSRLFPKHNVKVSHLRHVDIFSVTEENVIGYSEIRTTFCRNRCAEQQSFEMYSLRFCMPHWTCGPYSHCTAWPHTE